MSQTKRTYRLLQKTSKDFLVIFGTLFAVSTLALFLYTRYLTNDETDEELMSELSFVEAELQKGHIVPSVPPILIVQPNESIAQKIMKDTLIYDLGEEEIELFRELSKSTVVDGKGYRITVRTRVIESADLLSAIGISFVSVMTAAFFILFFVNEKRNKRLWKPFFQGLEQLKSFELESEDTLRFMDSNIEEFRELNKELKGVTSKLRSDYRNLKQFAADVSHETQTPLANIQAKIENIINQNSITEAQFEELTSIQKEIKRLSQLNSNLILLAKIDNKQFPKKEQINLKVLLEEKVEHFSSLTDKSLVLTLQVDPKIAMNSHLAHVLLDNLLTNSIKYGQKDGPITLVLSAKEFVISNYGAAPLANPHKVFQRFYKEGQHPRATGLGLSLVKKICDYYGYGVDYSFNDQHHVFTIRF